MKTDLPMHQVLENMLGVILAASNSIEAQHIKSFIEVKQKFACQFMEDAGFES